MTRKIDKNRKSAKKQVVENDNRRILNELEPLINELKRNGVKHNQDYTEGLGDVVEAALKKVGITEAKFKAFWKLQECGCMGRKKWLNGILHWHRKNK